MRRLIFLVLAILTLGVFATACTNSQPSGQSQEINSNQSAYDYMVKHQPGHTMNYSPTRSTINFWVDTWNHPNKLSYVYLQNSEGKIIGYYIFKGLPVTLCAALKPTVSENYDGNGNLLVPQPSADGVYYSGGQCNEYYGQDATSGAFVDYTVGLGINTLLYDQPLPRQTIGDAQNLAPKK